MAYPGFWNRGGGNTTPSLNIYQLKVNKPVQRSSRSFSWHINARLFISSLAIILPFKPPFPKKNFLTLLHKSYKCQIPEYGWGGNPMCTPVTNANDYGLGYFRTNMNEPTSCTPKRNDN